ncbi:MAG: type IX secretion system sortase PorU [Chitinophagaceae bacterium]
MLRLRFIFSCLLVTLSAFSQRKYQPSSVLASGSWFKIAVKNQGVYKVEVSLLNSLGINTVNIPSASIRLFGNGGQMLPENCAAIVADDLEENAIQMYDGGDGVFNAADYFLFYAAGPDGWSKDSTNHRFKHQKNLYSNQSFYFISIGGTGKRITTVTSNSQVTAKITSYNERYFHELDTINFLSSGKDWFGEEFANSPGRSVTRSFTVPQVSSLNSEPGTIISNCIARSVNKDSRFLVNINNTQVIQHNVGAAAAGNQDVFAINSEIAGTFTPSTTLTVAYKYESESLGAQGWLDWFEIFTRKTLNLAGTDQLLFRDWNSVGNGNTGEFNVQTASTGTLVWDITDPLSVYQMKTATEGNVLKFVNDCSSLHEYITFNSAGFLTPVAAGKVDNQDLHGSPAADFLIITYPAIMQEARRLADFHMQKDHLNVMVVNAQQVFNEFASGSPDPTAIRDFVKMYNDKATSPAWRPKYLLLFGDASFDYKGKSPDNTNFVPAFESRRSLDPLATYTSDDYFGFLDDNEDINSNSIINLLDIGIGRIPAKTVEEARSYVDKLLNYSSPESLGPWRNQLSFIADDEDYNLHFDDAEIITTTAMASNPDFMEHKIYLDAYQQESNSSGSRYPAVNQVINNQIQNGTLIWNYNGHGGFRRLAEEVILDQDVVNSWNNTNKLPLFITATCDFAPYDNYTINSLGENILLRPKTGAIALMTTTRLVFAFSNRIMNRNYMQVLLQQHVDGSYLSLGDAIKIAKNNTYQSGGDVINNLKFTLLGDPALTIAFPKYRVKTNTINAVAVSARPDTLKALKQYAVSGSVTDINGNTLTDFNGTVYSSVYDKVQKTTTLGNDPESVKEKFDVQENIVFKGNTTVKNGNFSFSFLVPQDINYQFGFGKISYYAENGQLDANGSFSNFVIGGSEGVAADKQGPEINAFLNDEKFMNGSITGQNPVLLLKLSDTSGINILGTGIGHDITAVVDADPKKTFKLNDFFEPVLNSSQAGTIRFPIPTLEEGFHTVKIKAWDAVNNSTEVTINCKVVKQPAFSLFRVFNFPNPFHTKTTFRFEHDLDAQNVGVLVQIYTVSGKLLKSIKRTINTGGNRSCDIEWDNNNDSSGHILNGIYIYRLRVSSINGYIAEKSGKMLIR